MNKELWQTYFLNYPASPLQDFMKYLYQSVFGGGHLINNKEENFRYLQKEYSEITYDPNHILFEDISEDLVRVHLEAIEENELRMMHSLFMKSMTYSLSVDELEKRFLEVEQGIIDGYIPFDLNEFRYELKQYRQNNYPIVRHSETFRNLYHPHYRIMKKEYIPLLHLLKKINNLKNHSVILIDGHCGSGKSTLANLLSDVFNYPTVHMDDFFLQLHQRTKERLSEPGGNVDYERFFKEVIEPIHQKQSFDYTIFDCHAMSLSYTKHISFDQSIIIEGCYCMHPYFKQYGSLSIFLDIDSKTQIERLLKRNGEKMTQRFINEWIPKENLYFDTYKIKEKADIIIDAKVLSLR